jgi:mannose-6-phosphate isomerase-like protein (cupin superfamily)
MAEQLQIAPQTTITVVERGDDVLELEARYGPGGSPPPPHLHPAQDERFEVVDGAMRTRVAGEEATIVTGDVLEIPRGTVHQMWNEGQEPAVLRWLTTPSGRTLDWFREIAAVQARAEPLGDPATLLQRYEDTFRLADGQP